MKILTKTNLGGKNMHSFHFDVSLKFVAMFNVHNFQLVEPLLSDVLHLDYPLNYVHFSVTRQLR